MSSDDDPEQEPSSPSAAAGDPGQPRRRYKRRKVAILLGYCGAGYQGMQKNPGARTIEGDLEEALYQAGAVPEADRASPRRYDWARAARTDKGVSAAAQVVSGRFYVDPPGFADRLNAQLAPQIRAFGYVRVTNSFNAKKFCDRRRYVYLLPVFALDPSAHPDREAVMASVGSGNELAKCVECSERGRKVPGVMGRDGKMPNAEEEKVLDASAEETVASHGELGSYGDAKCDPASSGGAAGNSHGEIESSGNVMIDLPSSGSGSEAQNAKLGSNGAEKCDIEPSGGTFHLEAVPTSVNETFCSNPIADSADVAAPIVAEKGHNFEPAVSEEEKVQAMDVEKSNGEELPLKKSTFSYTDEVKERFNRILKYYVGTHNFHNFTTRTKAEDPAAKRFIISFSADCVVSLDGIDFVRCEVVGQSFMLHQIRKMIGLAVAVLRNCTPESIYDVAFRKDVNLNVPTAPEVGLYLDDCMFTSYNKKWRDSQEAVSMEPYSEEAEEFKIKYILSHIAAMENKEGAIKTDKLLASLACQVKEEDNKRSQVIRIWDPGSESKNMKWGRIETSGHMLSFNVVTEDNVEIVSHQAEAERQLMQISVKIPSVGKNIKLNVKKSNSVVVVKAEIERKVGILMNKQILLYTDRQLEDNQMLSQCDLRNGQTLHVLVCPTDKLCIFVNVRGERIISLDVKCCYTVAEFSRPGVVVKHCKEGKYLYKVCPYKKASQVEGLSSTNLGRWDKFEESYRVMHFSNGDICWNGPDRNLKVRLRCELSNELNDIDEPSRCEYCFGDAAQVDKQLAYTLLLAENICQKHGINLLLIAPVGGRRRPQYTALNVPRECTLLVGWRPKSCTHSQTVVESPGPKSWKNVHFKEPGVILEEVDFCDTHFELILRQGRKLRFCSANLPLSENITVPAHLSDFHLFDLLLPNHVCQILSGPNYDYYSSTMRFTISSLVMSDAVIDYNLLNGKWQIVQQQKHAHTVPLFPHGACFVAASTNRLSSEDFEDRDWNELSEYYACEYYNVPTKDRALISLTLVYSLKHKQEGNPGCFMDMVQSGSTNYVRQNFYMDVEQLQA